MTYVVACFRDAPSGPILGSLGVPRSPNPPSSDDEPPVVPGFSLSMGSLCRWASEVVAGVLVSSRGPDIIGLEDFQWGRGNK